MPCRIAKAWLYKHGWACDESNRKGAYTLCDLKPTQRRKPPTKKFSRPTTEPVQARLPSK